MVKWNVGKAASCWLKTSSITTKALFAILIVSVFAKCDFIYFL